MKIRCMPGKYTHISMHVKKMTTTYTQSFLGIYRTNNLRVVRQKHYFNIYTYVYALQRTLHSITFSYLSCHYVIPISTFCPPPDAFNCNGPSCYPSFRGQGINHRLSAYPQTDLRNSRGRGRV